MGDMPEICSYLIAKGQAVLWSSQDDSNCKVEVSFFKQSSMQTAKASFSLNLSYFLLSSLLPSTYSIHDALEFYFYCNEVAF